MKLHTLHHEQLVERPRDEVFAFFARPENLAKITPPSMGFRILTPLPIDMKPGALIDYTVNTFGLTVRWTTLIAEFIAPERFVDVQIKGPYSFWHHAHEFHEADSGTRLVDHVTYALPFGPLGTLAHTLFVSRQLDRIFQHRRQVIADIFPASGTS